MNPFVKIIDTVQSSVKMGHTKNLHISPTKIMFFFGKKVDTENYMKKSTLVAIVYPISSKIKKQHQYYHLLTFRVHFPKKQEFWLAALYIDSVITYSRRDLYRFIRKFSKHFFVLFLRLLTISY